MNDIVIQKQTFNQEVKESVNARDLHKFLQIDSKFPDWIKNKLIDFIENKDYISFSKFLDNGGRTIEYYLTVETVKHISQMQRNEIGRGVRDYFIAREEQAKNLEKKSINDLTRKEIALMIIQSEEEKEKLQIENIKKQDIIETQEKTIEKISNIQDSYSLREASKNILVQETKLKDFIISKKWIVYLSDGFEGKKMYSTSYSKENDFAIDKAVLNKKHNKFYHQFRITKHGMDYLIKRREEISKI